MSKNFVGLLGAVVLVVGGAAAAFWYFTWRAERTTVVAVRKGQGWNDDAVKKTQPPATKLPVSFKRPITPEALEILADRVTAQTIYKLPDKIDALCVGGAGRFLVLYMSAQRKLGVFDVNEARIVRFVAGDDDKVHFAAGMNALVVYLPAKGLLQRFSLLDGSLELETKADLPGDEVRSFCLGHSSAGPLAIGMTGHGTRLYDIEQLKEIPLPAIYEVGAKPQLMQPGSLPQGQMWAGASGRVFGVRGVDDQLRIVALGETKIDVFTGGRGWKIIPDPDDRRFYAAGLGVFDQRFKPVADVPLSIDKATGVADLYLPAHHGPFFLHAATVDAGETPGTIRIFMHGSKEPIASYKEMPLGRFDAKKCSDEMGAIGIENSIHLIPRAKLLTLVPPSREHLLLVPADLEKAMQDAKRDYLFFRSSPPSVFHKGKDFTYQVDIAASKKPVTFKLESNPLLMTVNSAGLVRWKVPADFPFASVAITLRAREGANSAVQSFTIHDAPAPPKE